MSISTISIEQLIQDLRDHTQDILKRIDQDDALNHERTDDGLIIANAGAGLIEPKTQHQLYAKGIVYTPDFDLVSLPLLKFYNHGEKQLNMDLTSTLSRDPKVSYVCMEKLDGSMMQAFAHDGAVHLSTRSRLTSPHGTRFFSFHDEARAILSEQAPHVLDPQWLGDKTLIFELVSPSNRQYTNYHGQRAMILTNVFEGWRYWTADEIDEAAKAWGLPVASVLSRGDHMDDVMDDAYEALSQHPAASPEGFVLQFERQGELVHRTKIKTPSYKALRATVDDFSKRNLFKLLIHRKDLHQWDALEAAMTALYESRGKRGFDEERRKGFERHFHDFAPWFAKLERAYDDAQRLVPLYYESHPRQDTSDYHRAFALHHKAHHPETFPFVIRLHRQGKLTWEDVVHHFIKGLR